jgi:hypothetical protein
MCGLPLQFLCDLTRKGGRDAIKLCRGFVRMTLDTDADSCTVLLIPDMEDSHGRDDIADR